MVNRKRAKKRMKRNLLKRYKQMAKVPVLPKELKTHLLYKGKYENENRDYQSQLNDVYGKGIITPVERFISNQATLIHFCSKCSTRFYSQPRYLLNSTHDCSTGGIDSNMNYAKKQNNKVYKKINGDELVKDLDRMILSGVKPHLITSKIGVPSQILKWYKEKYHASKG